MSAPDAPENIKPGSEPQEDSHGVGLSVEEVRSLLHREASVSISRDDPLCLLVPILNAYMGEFDKFAARHREGFSAYLNTESSKFLDQAKQAADTLTRGVSQASVAEIKEAFQSVNKSLANFQSNMRLLSIVVVVASFANILAVILSNVRHW